MPTKKTVKKDKVVKEVKAEEVVETPVMEEKVEKKAVKKTEKTEKAEKVEKAEKTEKEDKRDFFFGYGRRKTATARARLYLPTKEVTVSGTKLSRGDIYVNGKQIDAYFNSPFVKADYSELYRTTNTIGRFITVVITSGSGKTGQAGATLLAIARALIQVDPKFKTILRKKGFVTRDPRAKERKKPGLMGARKQKSSPKR